MILQLQLYRRCTDSIVRWALVRIINTIDNYVSIIYVNTYVTLQVLGTMAAQRAKQQRVGNARLYIG